MGITLNGMLMIEILTLNFVSFVYGLGNGNQVARWWWRAKGMLFEGPSSWTVITGCVHNLQLICTEWAPIRMATGLLDGHLRASVMHFGRLDFGWKSWRIMISGSSSALWQWVEPIPVNQIDMHFQSFDTFRWPQLTTKRNYSLASHACELLAIAQKHGKVVFGMVAIG